MISDIRKDPQIDRKLEAAIILIDVIDFEGTKAKQAKKLKKELERYRDDLQFRRKVNQHNTMLDSQQDALIYYSEDYTGDYDYQFQEELETTFLKIRRDINQLLAWSIKKLTGEIDL